jgi:hypothetical protein
MAKSRRYRRNTNRRNSNRRNSNRRNSRKLVGGFDLSGTPSPLTMDDFIESNPMVNLNITPIQNTNESFNSLQNENVNLDLSNQTPPLLTMDDLNNSNMSNSGYTTGESTMTQTPDISNLSNISDSEIMNTSLSTISPEEENEYMDDLTNPLTPNSFGGRRTNKRKSRKSRKSKKSRKSRKSKKSKKSRKSRKSRKQKGGQEFTTEEESNPIEYKEDEYDQFKNALNYKNT